MLGRAGTTACVNGNAGWRTDVVDCVDPGGSIGAMHNFVIRFILSLPNKVNTRASRGWAHGPRAWAGRQWGLHYLCPRASTDTFVRAFGPVPWARAQEGENSAIWGTPLSGSLGIQEVTSGSRLPTYLPIYIYVSECASARTAAPYFIAGGLLRLLSRRRMEYAA